MVVYRALLYFNLPENIVFDHVNPKLVFQSDVGGGGSYLGSSSKTLSDLVQEVNGAL